MEVLGRDDELRSLEAFLDGEASGLAILALEGEAGIGKSTLWRAAVETARDRGTRVLTARRRMSRRTRPRAPGTARWPPRGRIATPPRRSKRRQASRSVEALRSLRQSSPTMRFARPRTDDLATRHRRALAAASPHSAAGDGVRRGRSRSTSSGAPPPAGSVRSR